MKKTLFDRAIDIKNGTLESRLVARMETEGRQLTDAETINELKYLKETFPYAGLDSEDFKDKMYAVNYLLKKYGERHE